MHSEKIGGKSVLVHNFFKNHSRVVKVIAVIIVSALMLGLVPKNAFSGFATSTQAAYVPEYDPVLGLK